MYPPIYRSSRKKRYRSSTDLHAFPQSIAKGSLENKKSLINKNGNVHHHHKHKNKSLSFRLNSSSKSSHIFRNSKWSKIRNATFSHQLFNQSLSEQEKSRKLEKLYKRLKIEVGSLAQVVEAMLMYDPKHRVDLADATMFVTLNHPIDSFTNNGKHINFLLSARFGVFNQVFHFCYGYEEEPSTYHTLSESTKLKLFNQNKVKMNFNWKFHNGNNVMHECVFGGNRDMLDLLLDSQCGIDINCTNNMGYTPLQIAASKHNYYAVFRLIMEGARIDYTHCHSCTQLINTMSNAVKGESLNVSMAMKQFQLRLHGQYHQHSDLSVRAMCDANPNLNQIVHSAEKKLQSKQLRQNLQSHARKQVLDRTASIASFTNNVRRMAQGGSIKSLIESRTTLSRLSKLQRYKSAVNFMQMPHDNNAIQFESDDDDDDDDDTKSLLVDFDGWRKSQKMSKRRKYKQNKRRRARRRATTKKLDNEDDAFVVTGATIVSSQWIAKTSNEKSIRPFNPFAY